MKLNVASTFGLIESTFLDPYPICEDGEGPRWKFQYDSWKEDPRPDILLLGAYQHPNTGNNLVGGINLNYLDRDQRDNLARVLPQIMAAGNLYSRYRIGRRLLPNVFDNFYRTYNAANIRGVEKDVLYPKYGFKKTATNFLKKTVGGLFKSKAQRAKDAEPQYPADLSGMDDMLDNVVIRLGQQPQRPQEPDNLEMQAARNAFNKFKIDRARSMADIEQQENEPLYRANQEIQQQQLAKGAVTPQAVQPQVVQQVSQQQQQSPPEMTPQQLGQHFEQERLENQAELLDPNNDINLDEAIRYFSPKDGRYIIESINIREVTANLLGKRLLRLRPQIAAVAQAVYDNWEQEDDEGGGICDGISEAIGGVLADNNIEFTEGGHDGDDHSYLIAYDDYDSFVVDIDPYIYERGGGYSWVKIPDVVFEPNNVTIAETDRPDWI